MPTLVIWGKQDNFISSKHAEVLQRLLPNVQVKHASIITKPNGSGQSIRNKRAAAPPKKHCLAALVDLPQDLDPVPLNEGQNPRRSGERKLLKLRASFFA
jgi:hypothetical protein